MTTNRFKTCRSKLSSGEIVTASMSTKYLHAFMLAMRASFCLMPIVLAGCGGDGATSTGKSPDDAASKAAIVADPVDEELAKTVDEEVKVDPLQRIYRILFDKVQFDGIDSLGESERVLFVVLEFRYDLNDGGLEYYLFNLEGEHVIETVAALRTLEMTAGADLLQRACELFPDNKPSSDIDERHQQLGQLTEAEQRELNDHGKGILIAFETAAENVKSYLEKHPSDRLSTASASEATEEQDLGSESGNP